jgi:glycosyltransferase involved in cell wall biosynthesis
MIDHSLPALSSPAVISNPEKRTFSALIYSHNDAQFLPTAIEAVLRQSRLPDELLIMDDGSTDDSLAVIQRYADGHSFIKIVRKERNRGYIKGVRQLTALAKGDFIHRGASDDFMLDCFVDDMMGMADRYPDVGIVSGALVDLDGDTGDLGLKEIPGWKTGFVAPSDYLNFCLETGPVIDMLAPGTILRREAAIGMGGWLDELQTWDIRFLMQAAALKHGMCYVDKPVYTSRRRVDEWTQSLDCDIARSTGMHIRYFELMRAPRFRELFGEILPARWLETSLRHSSEIYIGKLVESWFLQNGH